MLYRLALHAQSLFTAAACLGRRDELVLPGGDSAADLVSATLLKLLDPFNTSVTWSSTKGPPTTAGVLAYLREVLKRDFLDLVRSKRAKTSVYPDDERTGGEDLSESSLDQRTSSFGNPEDEHLRRERLVWLVELRRRGKARLPHQDRGHPIDSRRTGRNRSCRRKRGTGSLRVAARDRSVRCATAARRSRRQLSTFRCGLGGCLISSMHEVGDY